MLLITAETYSKYIHPTDRSLRTIFGDGAAATLIEAVDLPPCSHSSLARMAEEPIPCWSEGGARPPEHASSLATGIAGRVICTWMGRA